MTGPLRLNRCAICNQPRPDDHWAPGLDAMVAGDQVAWLCDDCEATPGHAWAFVDAVRGLYPEAELLTTAACADVLVRAPLILPSPSA